MSINLERNAYGPCGHHRANIGPQGCAICIALQEERRSPLANVPLRALLSFLRWVRELEA